MSLKLKSSGIKTLKSVNKYCFKSKDPAGLKNCYIFTSTVGAPLWDHRKWYHSVKAAVLKLGVATLFRVAKYFFKGRQSLHYRFLSGHFTFDSLLVYHSCVAEFWKYYEKGRDTKSLRTPGLKESMLSTVDWLVSNYSFIPNTGRSSFSYCYHLVNGISYGLAQSDPIKQHPLYHRLC